MDPDIPRLSLNDGHDIPQVGLGTYPMKDDEAVGAISGALRMGYRLVDTAAQYGNEESVGEGLRASGVPREDLRVMTKLAGKDHGVGLVRPALEASLERLGLDYVDYYLIHWPNPSVDKYAESFAAMVALRDEGLVRSVGVCNFKPAHLTRVHDETGVWPAVNQVQLSPLLARRELRAFHAEHDIVTVGWGPLGLREKLPERPAVHEVAKETGQGLSRTILRWAVQQGVVVIPKSASAQRQEENADLFGFELSEDQMAAMDHLDLGEEQAWDADTHEEF